MEGDWREHAPAAFKRAKPLPAFQGAFLKERATPAQRAVLSDYTDAGESLWINNYLRGRHLDDLSEGARRELRRQASHLNNLIRAAPRSPHASVVFRAVAQDSPQRQFYAKGDEAEFLSRGITSTSASYLAARDFMEDDETCCMLVLLLPKGTRMLQVMDESAWAQEQELLLPHGSTFRVVETAELDGVQTFYCALVTQRRA